jgi:FMN phosphatase YigB (HAD superfamily)
MSVISNSDGRTTQAFGDVGLRRYFEGIFESQTQGVEKPNPKIFERALSQLDLKPSEALYIGDIFEVDVKGANWAGLGAVHLDPLGLYAGRSGVHLRDVHHLPGWLDRYVANPNAFDVFPFCD